MSKLLQICRCSSCKVFRTFYDWNYFHLLDAADFHLDWRLFYASPDSWLQTGHPQCNYVNSCRHSLLAGVHRQTKCELLPASVDQWKISESTASPAFWQSKSGGENQQKNWGNSSVGCCWRWSFLVWHEMCEWCKFYFEFKIRYIHIWR